MRRRNITILAVLAALLTALFAGAAPAQAGHASQAAAKGGHTTAIGIPQVADCVLGHSFLWPGPKRFWPGECYQTPNGLLVMQYDGNFVLYTTEWEPWSTGTHQHPGAYAYFYGCELSIWWHGYKIWSSGTFCPDDAGYIWLRAQGSLILKDSANNYYLQAP